MDMGASSVCARRRICVLKESGTHAREGVSPNKDTSVLSMHACDPNLVCECIGGYVQLCS